MPLYLSGAIGALFKVRLSSHGYTTVAKGVEQDCLRRLQHKDQVYHHLRTIQGHYVPVCLGIIDLILLYYYDGAIENAVSDAFKVIHRSKTLYCDAALYNVLYNTHPNRIMVVDFERAKVI
ncbi:hypothetical protein F4808DRAFT_465405 [Astrocystis sublimbata]|nr:hypothetical protein F4808DRAFT_465405 [Astrocystis sublimbata]